MIYIIIAILLTIAVTSVIMDCKGKDKMERDGYCDCDFCNSNEDEETIFDDEDDDKEYEFIRENKFKAGDKIREIYGGELTVVRSVPGMKEYDILNFIDHSQGMVIEDGRWEMQVEWELAPASAKKVTKKVAKKVAKKQPKKVAKKVSKSKN